MPVRRRLGIVAPSGFLPDVGVVDRAASYFSSLGWDVSAGDGVFLRDLRFAGPDSLRLAELQQFACDPTLEVVLSARGGYGLSRLLDQIDYAAIRKRGPIMVGYSDFTAFSLAYLARGGTSFAGPSAGDFAAERVDSFTAGHFFGVLDQSTYEIDLDLDGPAGEFSGRLWGGNLAMVAALIGTSHFPRVRGGILFLEDVNEPAYKVERMFYQLAQSRALDRQAAIVLGDFEPIIPMPNDNGYSLDAAIARLREMTPVPVYTGLPFGHVARKLTLPVGGRARLSVSRSGSARLALARYPYLR
jgi:muramoyltetrapeptide carboxypeptidase